MAETNVTIEAEAAKPALSPMLWAKLSGMMFLQYAIWGIWAPILGLHLGSLPAFQMGDGTPNWGRIGLIYMTMPIASIIGPFIGGQIADRYFAAQNFLAMSQILGGAVLLVVARLTGFAEVFVGMLVYQLLYAPTIAITNSITFQHWPNNQFGKVRMCGSIGWIVIGLAFGFWMSTLGKMFHSPIMGDCLYLAGIFSFVYGIYAFTLPRTPPSKQAGNPLAFLDAVGMLKKPAFAVMALVSFFVAIDMQLYFVLTQNYLNQCGGPFKADQIAQYWGTQTPGKDAEHKAAAAALVKTGDKDNDSRLSLDELADLAKSEVGAQAFLDGQQKLKAEKGGVGLHEARVSQVLTFGQICEMVMMFLLPLAVSRLGYRVTMVLGIAAWAVRDLAFAVGPPTPIVLASIALHGVGFAFFFTTIFMFTDLVAPKDIKSSAQSFLASVTIGCGMLVGSLLPGHISAAFDNNWHRIYMVPAILCAVCCVLMLVAFRPKEQQAS